VRETTTITNTYPKYILSQVSLSIGDPTVFGNFKCPDHFHDQLIDISKGLKFNGYPPAVGYPVAREAIAETHTHASAPLTAKDVILTSGCSQALEMCFSALANEGDNVLLPKPGFSLYKTICDANGIEVTCFSSCLKSIESAQNEFRINVANLADLDTRSRVNHESLTYTCFSQL